MNLKEFYSYKNRLMKDLCCNEGIVKLVTGNAEASVPNHGLPYTQVFPYEFVPETVDEAKTFICFDTDIARVPNKTFYFPVLYIWIFTHKSKMRMPEGGILLDELAQEIDAFMNGNRFYGLGEMRLESVQRFVPVQDYQGRVLLYTARDFNRPSAKRQIPSNRQTGV